MLSLRSALAAPLILSLSLASCAGLEDFGGSMTSYSPSHGASIGGAGSPGQHVTAHGQATNGGTSLGQVMGAHGGYQSPGSTTINGRPLSAADRQQFFALYGVQALPGEWWYDSRSGAYGPIGGPVVGVLQSGHDFGPLPANASGGTSSLYVNGRRLTLQEAQAVASVTGLASGNLWLDAQGNLGVEGQAFALVNIAQLAASSPRGQGRDNIWSTRFSSGHWNDQGEGYVMVPGHGAIGYD